MKKMERLLWRCRRGLLELDIVLGRFVEHDYAKLNEVERIAFDELLDLPDTVLWDMASGRIESEELRHKTVLEKIRTA
jgi:antitoxin CptB